MALSHAPSFHRPWPTLARRDERPVHAAERWECLRCGRSFETAKRCCAHEEQCGGLTRC